MTQSPIDVRLAPAAIGLWILSLATIELGPLIGMALAACSGLAALVLVRQSRRRSGRRHPRGRRGRHRVAWVGWGRVTLLIACVTISAGGAVVTATVIAREEAVADITGLSGQVHVRLRSDPTELGPADEYGAQVQLVRVQTATHRWRGQVPAFLIGEIEDLRAGHQISLPGHISGGRDLFIRARAGPPAPEPMRGLDGRVDGLRHGLRDFLAEEPGYVRGLIPGIAIGDDRELPERLTEAMRTTSLTHLTAVSGGHVAVVVGTVLIVLTRAPAPVRAIGGVGVLVAMALLVLPTASVVRAGAMGVVTLIALGCNRPRMALPALAAATIVLLLLDPWRAGEYGFALSVSATAGLVVWTEPLAARLHRWLPIGLARVVALPIAAQCWCAPVLILLNPMIATYSVPANLLAVTALPAATLLGMMTTVLASLVPSLAGVTAAAAQWPVAWIAAVADFFAHLPAAELVWPGGPAGALMLAAMIGGSAVWAHERWQRPIPS